MSLSPAARQSIEAFAAQLGLAARASSDESHTFVFEKSGTLNFTAAAGERVVMSLSRQPEIRSESMERRVLQVAGPDAGQRLFLHAGMTRDGTVIFAVSVDEPTFDLPMIETCLQRLLAAQAAIG